MTTKQALLAMFAMLFMMIAALGVAAVLVQLRIPTCSPSSPAMMLPPPASDSKVYPA